MTLPVLLSIPHGGTSIPSEIRPLVIAGQAAMFSDGDPLTRDIYDLGSRVEAVVAATVARSIVDINRSPDDLPPFNPDGVVKTHTCQGFEIYSIPLSAGITTQLLIRYHKPYHDRLLSALSSPNLVLALDCHSMLPCGPMHGPDQGRDRPLICLSNNEGQTATDKMTTHFAKCLRRAFDLRADQVRINDPFLGGYIVRTHGMNPIPWLQVELNRSLYLHDPPFGSTGANIIPGAVEHLRRCFQRSLELMFQ